MNKYLKAINKEFIKLAKLKNTIFLGQQVFETDCYGIFKDIPKEKRLELPVVEELQLSMSVGLALEGFLPISFFQRHDFLFRAMDSLCNQLELLKDLSRGLFNPKVLIVTTVGVKNSGLQHNKDITKGLKALLKSIKIFNPKTAQQVKESFKKIKRYDGSSVITFYQELFK